MERAKIIVNPQGIPACISWRLWAGKQCVATWNTRKDGKKNMRTIDADALQQHFTDMQKYEQCAANFPDHRGEPSTNWYCVEDALENAPTVEAIPVEWLEKMHDTSIVYSMYLAIECLIEEWRKEQDART